MAMLSLKISVIDHSMVKTMQFDPSTTVYDATRIIREKVPEFRGDANDYGLFLADEDPRKGIWLESLRNLEYYLLRNGDLLEYKKKILAVKIKTLDGSLKTVPLDDSHNVGQLMVVICLRIGITNHDEYSLVRELTDEDRTRTLTLRKDKSIARDQKKMDEMKKKLHTDDELDWLDHGKSLREQGVDPSEILLLRRKYFFSDQNIDARDPIQLNLLYVQMRDAILKGAHPVNIEEAIKFAGFQAQIQFGDHNASKHKSGFIDLKEFLPKEYVKVKGIEKKIYAGHSTLTGMSDNEAKAKYTQLARSLKTYGITFFLVKEKMKGRNKLVPRLLGITKESVVRVDENTKEVIKTYKLTTVRRWAASPNSFTLDLGDYADSYYAVQTLEGEQIAQLISGYIDIILKKQGAKDYLGIDVDDDSTMVEDSVAPSKATIMQMHTTQSSRADMGSVALPAVLRVGEGGPAQFSTGSLQPAKSSFTSQQAHIGGHVALSSRQSGQVHALGQAQRALLGVITDGLDTIREAELALKKHSQDETDSNSQLGSDPAAVKWREGQCDLSRQKLNAEMSAMSAATAQVVSLTSHGAEHMDYIAVGAAMQAISFNLGLFSQDVCKLSSLDDNARGPLMSAARRLAGAFTELLTVAQPGSAESRQALITAASRVGEVSQDVMTSIEQESALDKEFKDRLMALAKSIATVTAGLVLTAKDVSSLCQNESDQNRVIGSATQCAVAASQLVTCTKIVVPTLASSAECQEQVVEAAKLVAGFVDSVVQISQEVCSDDEALNKLGLAATMVSKTLDDFMQHIRHGTSGPQTAQMKDVKTIMMTTEKLYVCATDTTEMITQATTLAKATSQLSSALKAEAALASDSTSQTKLLTAAKLLADATARMVEAAKGCARQPQSKDNQDELKRAVDELRSATTISMSSDAVQKQAVDNLQQACKRAASSATHLINSSAVAAKSNTNVASQSQLNSQCHIVSDETVPHVVQALRSVIHLRPGEDPTRAHLALVNVAQDLIQTGGRLVSVAQAVQPTVADQSAALGLANCCRTLAAALADLCAAVGHFQDTVSAHPTKSPVKAAVEQISGLQTDLSEVRQALAAGRLVPLPGESAESCAAQLGAISKTLGSSMAQLLTASAQGNVDDTGSAAQSTVDALRQLVAAAHGVAATTQHGSGYEISPDDVINSVADVLDKSLTLMKTAQLCIDDPQNPENKARLAQVAKSASVSLNGCVNCLPGIRDVDQVAKYVTTVTIKLSQTTANSKLPAPKCNIIQARSALSERANELNKAASDVASAASDASSHQLAPALHRFSRAYEEFVDSGLETTSAAAAAGDAATQNEVVSGLRGVSTVASRLLIAAKSVLVNPNAPDARNQLTVAARAVTESINQLITVCAVTMTSVPGQKECDAALRKLQAHCNLLENPCQPVVDGTYFDCLDRVTDKSKLLAESIVSVSNSIKQGNIPAFNTAISDLAETVNNIVDNAAQSAYLVGIADPSSVPGRAGIMDPTMIAKSVDIVQAACQTLSDSHSTVQQVHSAIASVGQQTALLCNACRTASANIDNAVARRQLVQLAKDIAGSTVGLVQAVKALDGSSATESRQRCTDSSHPLLHNLDLLLAVASSPEYCGAPAVISDKARIAQLPITSAAKSIVDGAIGMVQSAKILASNPRDPSAHQMYSTYSHSLSDAIKTTVVALRQGAPGQQECEAAIQSLDSWINLLDQASLAAVGQNLHATQDGSLSGFQEQVIASARQLLNQIEPLRSSAKGEIGNLHKLVSSACGYIEPLTTATINCASRTVNSKFQMTLLDQSKTVVESMHNLLVSIKAAGGNAKAVQSFAAIDEAADSAKEMLQELVQTLEESAASTGLVTSLVHNLMQAVSKVTASSDTDQHAGLHSTDSPSYVDCQTNIVKLTKQVAQTVQEMMSKSVTNVQELGVLANTLTRDYGNLATECCRIVQTSTSTQVTVRIKSAIQSLGTSCIELVQDAGSLQSNPGAQLARRDIALHSRKVLENISDVVMAVQSGSRGTQACINASSAIDGVIADLDTTVMFAAAGTLEADAGQTFANHRDGILKMAKELVDGAKTLVGGATSPQDQLVAAANDSKETLSRLAESVKHGAAALGSHQPDAQVMLINAVKDVASALRDLIGATKNAAGKSPSDPSVKTLKDSAKIMVTNVTSLLKTVKTVEDETLRGTQALESSIQVISQEAHIAMVERSEQKVTPDELLRLTRPITMATVKAVAAGNSGQQEDIIAAANLGRKAISDLLRGCRSSLVGASNQSMQQHIHECGKKCAFAYQDLLQHIQLTVTNATAENKQQSVVKSKMVATAVAELVRAIEDIRGSDWVDPSDPTVIAENELLSAASSIEAAAKKLSQLQPRQRPREADESLNFEEQILEAAKSIATATAALVKAASVAQRELVAQGKIGMSSDVDEDSQWSQGLVSAARLVAIATHSLCDAANAMVQGQASEERLISSAKQVAASTAQLLVACQVKADPNSQAMKRLQNAGNAVKRATEALVREAQNKTKSSLESQADVVDAVGTSITVSGGSRLVSGMAQVIAAQEEILKKERELEAARQKLKHIRQAHYMPPSSGSESPSTPKTATTPGLFHS